MDSQTRGLTQFCRKPAGPREVSVAVNAWAYRNTFRMLDARGITQASALGWSEGSQEKGTSEKSEFMNEGLMFTPRTKKGAPYCVRPFPNHE